MGDECLRKHANSGGSVTKAPPGTSIRPPALALMSSPDVIVRARTKQLYFQMDGLYKIFFSVNLLTSLGHGCTVIKQKVKGEESCSLDFKQ